jgi:hypothetical protein
MKNRRKPPKPVTLRTKGNTAARRTARRMADEPEMRELSRMIDAGELDAGRAARYTRDEAKKEAKR